MKLLLLPCRFVLSVPIICCSIPYQNSRNRQIKHITKRYSNRILKMYYKCLDKNHAI